MSKPKAPTVYVVLGQPQEHDKGVVLGVFTSRKNAEEAESLTSMDTTVLKVKLDELFYVWRLIKEMDKDEEAAKAEPEINTVMLSDPEFLKEKQ